MCDVALAARSVQQGDVAKIWYCVHDVTLHVRNVLQCVRDCGVTRVMQCVLIGCDFDTKYVLIGCDFDTK